MRFRLRTLLIVVLLLCVTAPWWNDWRSDLSTWLWPPKNQPPASAVIAQPPAWPMTDEEFAEIARRSDGKTLLDTYPMSQSRFRSKMERLQPNPHASADN